MLAEILCLLVKAYLIVLLGRILLSWFPIESGSVMASLYGFVYTVTEPVLGPLRRLIPPVRVGGMGLDLSLTILVFALFIIAPIFGCSLAF